MTAMKQSGIDRIGEIPSGWDVIRMKLYAYLKGRIGRQGLKAEEFIDEGPFLVTGTDFENGRICRERSCHVSEKRYGEAPQIQLKVGDLLVTKDGTIGKLAYVDSLPGKASLNSHLLLIRPLCTRFHKRKSGTSTLPLRPSTSNAPSPLSLTTAVATSTESSPLWSGRWKSCDNTKNPS